MAKVGDPLTIIHVFVCMWKVEKQTSCDEKIQLACDERSWIARH